MVGVKNSEKIIRIALIISVLLSIYFSINIWLNPSKKERLTLNDSTGKATVVNERLDIDAFLPLRLVRIKENNTEINTSENLITNIQNEISSSSFGSLSKKNFENEEKFKQSMEMNQGFELLYEGSFSLSEYLDVYRLDMNVSTIKKLENILFNCLQVDLLGEKIRFCDFENKEIYEATIEINTENVNNLMNKVGSEYYNVSNEQPLTYQYYYLTDKLKMKKYSYILAAQPVSKFLGAFFSDVDDVQTNEDSNDLSYTSTLGRMVVDNQLKTVNFKGELDQKKLTGNLFSESFTFIKKLGTGMGNLRYFDLFNNEVTYRTFVEGFPVFNKDNKGEVQITIDKNQKNAVLVAITTNMDTIQVPIPSEDEVILENSSDLLESLNNAGIEQDKIDSITIGYTWQNIEETAQVVDLMPEWYIRYEGNWYSKEELVEYVMNVREDNGL